MEQNLGDFLVGIASDPDRTARFAIDPGRELEHSGLSPEERAIVLSRDSRRIMAALGESGFALGEVTNRRRKRKRTPTTPGMPRPGKKKVPARKKPGRRTPTKR